MIEAVNLHKMFGLFQAVKSMTLHVDAGEVVALLGPNGAGKTTTVRMLAAILQPTSGSARIAGYDVVKDAQKVRNVVGLLTEFPGLYHRMRPLEYLEFFGELQGVSRQETKRYGEELLKRFDLWPAREKRLDAFSKGMKQKVSLIRALIHKPSVLYLDEPTTAMDPHSARTVRDAMMELRNARRTILLTTHNLTEAEELADRIVIVRGGEVIAEGTREELTRQLLGEPIWELRLTRADERLTHVLTNLAVVEALGDDWVQFRCTDPHTINPQILTRCHELGLTVLALTEQPRSLEHVYLQIVAGQANERGVWSPSATNGVAVETNVEVTR
jgi:ABC-2 type transport system ATP-binding protein